MSEEMNQTNGVDEEAKKGGEDEQEIKEAEKKYSDADLNEIINQKFAKWQEKQDKAVADAKAEAEKLAKMNADQKAQYEAEQKDKLISEMQSQLQQIAMGKVATELNDGAEMVYRSTGIVPSPKSSGAVSSSKYAVCSELPVPLTNASRITSRSSRPSVSKMLFSFTLPPFVFVFAYKETSAYFFASPSTYISPSESSSTKLLSRSAIS